MGYRIFILSNACVVIGLHIFFDVPTKGHPWKIYIHLYNYLFIRNRLPNDFDLDAWMLLNHFLAVVLHSVISDGLSLSSCAFFNISDYGSDSI